MKKQKPKINKMDIILIFIFASLVVFSVVMINCYYRTGGIPDTLVTCVFAALGGECGFMGMIKTAKIRKEDRVWQKEDREYYDKK